MDRNDYNSVIKHTLRKSLKTLIKKRGEYAAEDDLFHNFHVAAELQGCTPKQALAGMMAKHTVSIYDMCSAADSDAYTPGTWDEKICDHINYLLLLRALAEAEREQNDDNAE